MGWGQEAPPELIPCNPPATMVNTPKLLVPGVPWAPSEFRGEPVVVLSLVSYL